MRLQPASPSVLEYSGPGPSLAPDGAATRSVRGRAFEMTVEVLDSIDDLAGHVRAWDELAVEALEPNAFYESWMLQPAARAFARRGSLLFVLIYTQDSTSRGPRLCGFFPVEKHRFYKGLPISALALWRHLHCFICTPLLHPRHAREALDAFLDWAARDPRGAPLIEFGHAAADGPFRKLLVDCLNQRQAVYQVPAIFNRALLETAKSAEVFLTATLSPGFRKEMRRLRRRLAETGHLEFRVLKSEDEFEGWLNQFLELEASGWKGSNGAGTAIALSRRQSGFLEEIWREAIRRNRLQLTGLFLEGRPIALGANILAGDGGFHFKISYDEAMARFSPGVLLELDLIQHIHDHPSIRWIDSCATPGHPMINRLWPGRRTMQTVVLSTGSLRADLFVSLLPALRWLKALGRGYGAASGNSMEAAR
jgi:CelD/BcsL family acetyltransferase involved in cellulose biosynthesis